jgi:hypothetical protein
VLVVVLAVSRMPAPVVHIVDMIPVRDGYVATPLTVDMARMLMHRVARWWVTFVVVILVLSMKVTVVHVVNMVPMRDRDMPASIAVDVIMVDVRIVGCAGQDYSPPSNRLLARKLLALGDFSPSVAAVPKMVTARA